MSEISLQEYAERIERKRKVLAARGEILCGDCRYEKRHGERPRRERKPGEIKGVRNGRTPTDSEDYGGSETLGRFRHIECETLTEYKILSEQ